MDQSFDDVWAECEDLFVQARQTLATLKAPQPAHVIQAAVNALFRSTHTLKGMAGMLGFPRFSQAAHRMEDIFDLMRQGRLRSTDSLVETLESGIQALESGLAGLRRGLPEPDDYLQALRRQRHVVARRNVEAVEPIGRRVAVVGDSLYQILPDDQADSRAVYGRVRW